MPAPRTAGPFDLNLTPLLDVVLQLITFFMMLIHFGTRLEGATTAIRLPTAPAALPGADLGLDRLVVAVDATGGCWPTAARSTRPRPRPGGPSRRRRRRAGQATLGAAGDEELPTVVIVRADRDASYGAVRRLLAAAQEQGFAHFSLVVLRRADR